MARVIMPSNFKFGAKMREISIELLQRQINSTAKKIITISAPPNAKTQNPPNSCLQCVQFASNRTIALSIFMKRMVG